MKSVSLEASMMKRIGELNTENKALKAEAERLRASSFVTAVPVEEYEKLKVEVERLKEENEVLQNRCDFLEGRNKE